MKNKKDNNNIERRDIFEALKNSKAQSFLQQIKSDNANNSNQGNHNNNNNNNENN
jgi:hypothetical protein